MHISARIIINARVIRGAANGLTGEPADEHGGSAHSCLAGPLVLLVLGVALDVDLLLVDVRVLPGRVPVVLLVQASVDVLIQLLRGARQPLAANRTARLVRFPLPILNAYSGLRMKESRNVRVHIMRGVEMCAKSKRYFLFSDRYVSLLFNIVIMDALGKPGNQFLDVVQIIADSFNYSILSQLFCSIVSKVHRSLNTSARIFPSLMTPFCLFIMSSP